MKHIIPLVLLLFIYSCTASSNNNTMSTNTDSIKIDEGILHPINGHNISIQYIAKMEYEDKDGQIREGMAASVVVNEAGETAIVGQSSTFQLGETIYLVTDVQAPSSDEFDQGFIIIEELQAEEE